MEHLRIQKVHECLQIAYDEINEFQDIVNLAAELCDKPVAIMTLLDENENCLVVRAGVEAKVMPRKTSFCQYCIKQEDVFIVNDASKDARFDDNPLVHNNPKLRFYAGAPLKMNGGLTIGALCLFDVKPGEITEKQQKILAVLSKQVVNLIELNLSQTRLHQQVEETEAKNEALRKIAQMQSHYIRQPLTSVMGLVDNVKDGYFKVDDEWLKMMIEATTVLDNRIRNIVTESVAKRDIKALRFSKMVEEIEDYAILMLDSDGNIENWNKGAQKIKGYKAYEIIGKNFSVFYTMQDRNNKRPEMLLAQARKTGKAKDEGWRVRNDGSMFWGSILITAIHNDEGLVIGFTKVTRDLTEAHNKSFNMQMASLLAFYTWLTLSIKSLVVGQYVYFSDIVFAQ